MVITTYFRLLEFKHSRMLSKIDSAPSWLFRVFRLRSLLPLKSEHIKRWSENKHQYQQVKLILECSS